MTTAKNILAMENHGMCCLDGSHSADCVEHIRAHDLLGDPGLDDASSFGSSRTITCDSPLNS